MDKKDFLSSCRAALFGEMPSAILRARGIDPAAVPAGVGWLDSDVKTPEGLIFFGGAFLFWDSELRVKCYPVETDGSSPHFGHRVQDDARGARHITTEKGAVFSVFYESAPSVVVMVEGEFDALAVASCGLSVIASKSAAAIPAGASAAILFDADDAGAKQSASILKALRGRDAIAAGIDLGVYHGKKDFSETLAATPIEQRETLAAELRTAVRRGIDAARPLVLDENEPPIDAAPAAAPSVQAFRRSALYALARRFGGYIDETAPAASAQVGGALAMIAAAARGRMYSSLGAGVFPVRFTGITIGASGAGKGCEIEVIRRLCEVLNVRNISPGSDAALMQEIAAAGADADKMRGSNEIEWRVKGEADPVFEIIDEAGSMRAGTKKLDYAARGDAIRRMLYAERVQLPSTRATPFPRSPVPVVYNSMFFSTAEAWVDSIAGDDTTAGEARRRLEFHLSEPPVADGEGSFARRKVLSRCAVAPASPAGLAEALGILSNAMPRKTVFMPRFDEYLWDDFDAACRNRLGAADDAEVGAMLSNAMTPLCGIAASAAAIAGHDAIYNDDFLTAIEVVVEVFAYRRRLLASHVSECETQGARVSAFVLGVIRSQAGARGYARHDSVVRTLRGRGRDFEDALKFLIDSGVVESVRAKIGKTKRTVLRIISADEFAAREASREAAPIAEADAAAAAPAEITRRADRHRGANSSAADAGAADEIAAAVSVDALRGYMETVKAHGVRGRSGKHGSIVYGIRGGRAVFFDHSEQVGGDCFDAVSLIEGIPRADFGRIIERAREVFGVQ